MCSVMAAGAAISTVGILAQGYAQQQQGKQVYDVANYNASLMEKEAGMTIREGKIAQNQLMGQARALQSTQKAQQAASGVDVTEGTAATVREDTKIQATADALRIGTNVSRQAEALKQQAVLERKRGKAGLEAGRWGMYGSLLGGVGNVVSSRWS